MRTSRRLFVVAAALGAAMIPAGVVLAGKPGGGGGGTPPGTINFSRTGGTAGAPTSILSMDGAGANVTTLATNIPPNSNVVRASRLLHGGKRWFITQEIVPGEAGIHGSSTRIDLFAVREDGAANVRLTSDPTMQFIGIPATWAPDETAAGATVSWLARRWTGTSSSDTVVSGSCGIYAAHVAFDGAGDVVGLDVAPSRLVSVGTAVLGGFETPDAHAFAWSPDMTRVVCDRISVKTDIRVVDVPSGAATVIATAPFAMSPDWSADGTKIAFVRQDRGNKQNPNQSIATVSPTGAGLFIAYKSDVNLSGGLDFLRWSPDGAFLAFWELSSTNVNEFLRVAAAGGSATVLSGSADSEWLGDWR